MCCCLQHRLDAENEYYLDVATNKLYLWYNGTGTTPPSSVVVPTLADMIVINGSKGKPVQNVTLGPGLQLRDNRPTYMEPRTNPSGGDWALERQGAILLEGCEGCVIQGNRFHHLDSNAVMISGYNRGTVIRKNGEYTHTHTEREREREREREVEKPIEGLSFAWLLLAQDSVWLPSQSIVFTRIMHGRLPTFRGSHTESYATVLFPITYLTLR